MVAVNVTDPAFHLNSVIPAEPNTPLLLPLEIPPLP